MDETSDPFIDNLSVGYSPVIDLLYLCQQSAIF
jgi:hypothetical protein